MHIPTLDEGRLIVWEVEFESDDPRFSGTMAMHWYLSRKGGGTLVTALFPGTYINANRAADDIDPELLDGA